MSTPQHHKADIGATQGGMSSRRSSQHVFLDISSGKISIREAVTQSSTEFFVGALDSHGGFTLAPSFYRNLRRDHHARGSRVAPEPNIYATPTSREGINNTSTLVSDPLWAATKRRM